MITIYHWEDDPNAEDLIDELKKRGLEYEVELLDAEVASSTSFVEHEGKAYEDFDEFLKALA